MSDGATFRQILTLGIPILCFGAPIIMRIRKKKRKKNCFQNVLSSFNEEKCLYLYLYFIIANTHHIAQAHKLHGLSSRDCKWENTTDSSSSQWRRFGMEKYIFFNMIADSVCPHLSPPHVWDSVGSDFHTLRKFRPFERVSCSESSTSIFLGI